MWSYRDMAIFLHRKTTIDLPDDLYRRVKSRSALEGCTAREVTIEPYRGWLERRGPEPGPEPPLPGSLL